MARGSVNIGGKNYDYQIVGFVDKTTVFSVDGMTITETYGNGDTLETVFSVDGATIAETYTQGSTVAEKTTTFNEDGSISEVVL